MLGWKENRGRTMAETIGTAYIQIEPSFDGVVSEIDKKMGGAGESGGKSFGSGFGKVLGGTGKAIAGAMVAGTAAVTAMGGAFINATNGVASYGDNIDKMSQKMGLTAEAYQEWDAVMQHSGTSMESMKSSMKTLANAAETGNKAFAELGITEQDLANMNQQELFEATIAGLQNVDDTTQRTYLAGKLLGKGATELGALLNTSAEDTQAMRDRVKELGGVMSDDAVKASAAYQDQLQDMQTAFSGLSRNMISEFLPSVTQVMGGLTEVFNGNSDTGIAMISEGINSLVTNISAAIPQVMSVASGIISALGQAILDNLPVLLSTGMSILEQLMSGILQAIPTALPTIISFVMQLGNMIIENLPQLLEVGMQVIVQLALGIANALPELLPTIVEVVVSLVSYLLDNIDLLIDAAIQLMIGLANGLVNALPILVEKAPIIIMKLVEALIRNIPKLLAAGKQIITTIGNGLKTAIPQLLSMIPGLISQLKQKFLTAVKSMVDVGKDIVEGIKSGIKNAWSSMTGWVKDLAADLVKKFKEFFKIGSPSKLMAEEIGKWIPAGIAEGIYNGMSSLDTAVDAVSAEISPSYDLSGYSVSETVENSDTKVFDLLIEYLPEIARAIGQPIEVVQDNKGMFEAVRGQNSKFITATGYHALA